MYAYFIDSWVYDKYSRKLDKLDLGLTQKGISGRKIKISQLYDLGQSIKECASCGIKTFVAIGDDCTASRVLNNILRVQNSHFVFSFIPMAKESRIAKVFGYFSAQEAINALCSHRTRKIDVGVLNNRHFFLTSAIFPSKCSFGFESYSVSSLRRNHQISVCNIDIYRKEEKKDSGVSSVVDGVFEAIIARKIEKTFFDRVSATKEKVEYAPDSIFPIKSIVIKSKEKTISVFADAEKQLATPVLVEVLPQYLEIIIGEKFYG